MKDDPGAEFGSLDGLNIDPIAKRGIEAMGRRYNMTPADYLTLITVNAKIKAGETMPPAVVRWARRLNAHRDRVDQDIRTNLPN